MTDITANSTVYPSSNDIAEVAKEGRFATEQSHTDYVEKWMQNHIVSGFLLPATDPDLTISIPSGTAILDGARVVVSAATALLLTAASTNHIFIQLSVDGGGDVDGVDIIANTTGAVPVRSAKIGRAITDGTTVTSTINGDRDRSPYIGKQGLELIESKTAGSDVTTLSFTDIFGDRDEIYRLIGRAQTPATPATRFDLQPNGISATQAFFDVTDGATGTTMKLCELVSGLGQVFFDAIIHAKSGKDRIMISHWSELQAAGVIVGDTTMSRWLDSSTVITSLDIVSAVASGIDSLSEFSLYRVRE